jgi:hypothetical protein
VTQARADRVREGRRVSDSRAGALHAIIRVDGAEDRAAAPGVSVSSEELRDAINQAAGRACLDGDAGDGDTIDIRVGEQVAHPHPGQRRHRGATRRTGHGVRVAREALLELRCGHRNKEVWCFESPKNHCR